MSSRAEILHRLRLRNVVKQPIPDLSGSWITYDDPVGQFATVLEQVGGRAVKVSGNDNILSILIDKQEISPDEKVISTLPGGEVPKMNRPHQAADFDVSIVNGSFGVAENGAIWLVDHGTDPHRSCLFLVEHLVLVVRSASIVNNMHEAYARIGNWPDVQFGIFISGPSKTADIEQSLVIGAQGPRRHTVVIVD